MPRAAQQSRITFRAEDLVECGGDSQVGGLETELVDGHASDLDRRVVKCERNDQPDDIAPQRQAFASLAAE